MVVRCRPEPTRCALFRVCAWCDTFLGAVHPLRDPGVTHTICPRCVERLQREERRTRGRVLVIVRRSWQAVQERLEAAFAGVPDVTVRTDQRVGERRGAGGPAPGPDRRRVERRRGLTGLQRIVWEAFGVWLSR